MVPVTRELDFSGSPDTEPPIDEASARGLRHIVAFLDCVDVLQAREPGRNTRKYLADVLDRGWFEIVSPFSGIRLRSGSSLVLVDRVEIAGEAVPFAKVFAVSFPEEPGLLLGIGDVSLGYPICAAVATELGVLLCLGGTAWGFGAKHLGPIDKLMQQTGWRPGLATDRVSLVLGDANFAHHAWNQLAGLEEIAGPVRVVATHQPLGPIDLLFPGLTDGAVAVCSEAELEAMNGVGRLFMPVGGSVLPRVLAERVAKFAPSQLGTAACGILNQLRGVEAVIWLSVRTRNRTAVNQHEFLVALGLAIARVAPEAAIVLDGYSIAADTARYSPYHQREARIAMTGDRQAAEAIRDALLDTGEAPAAVHIAVGLDVAESIALAGRAVFYVCHHGTVQHKIGWFTSTPGVVHSNKAILERSPAAWVVAQSEIAVAPAYLPPELVGDLAAGETELAAMLQQQNYRILDIPAAVAFVLAQAPAGHFTQRRPPGQDRTGA